MVTTERGLSAQILIKGVTILDESQYQGTRQPNIINNVSFTALDIVPMTKLSGKDGMVMSSFTSSQEGIFNGKGGMKPGAQDTSGSSILADVERRSFARSLKANGDIERWNNG
jgi:hypothetical protein